MNFEFKDGLIWISVDLIYEGKLVKVDKCILDTGSETTAIDIDIVNFNYQKPSFIRRLYGLGGGVQEVICQKIDKFVIDKKEIDDIEIEFGNLKSDLGINGFVGNDILSQFITTINFLHYEIEIDIDI